MSSNTGSQNLRPVPKLSEGQLEPLFRRLNLAHTRRVYQAIADRAEKENWSYRDFLALLLAEEVGHRKQTRLQRFTHKADFPFLKTIDEFDFTLQSTLKQSLLGSYLGPDFITEGRSLIFYGKAGRGKTHLAVAIGYRAIQNGFETLCTTAAELIEDLSNASKRGQLQEALLTYTRPHVLICDELGYLTYGADAANVLFHVVNHRHLRKRPMIFTTNKPLSEWGKVLHDEDLAAAILDRVLERGRFIQLDGPSGRTRHLNLDEVWAPKEERLRISGINGSKFPERTSWRDSAVVLNREQRRKSLHKGEIDNGNSLFWTETSLFWVLRVLESVGCNAAQLFVTPKGAEHCSGGLGDQRSSKGQRAGGHVLIERPPRFDRSTRYISEAHLGTRSFLRTRDRTLWVLHRWSDFNCFWSSGVAFET